MGGSPGRRTAEVAAVRAAGFAEHGRAPRRSWFGLRSRPHENRKDVTRLIDDLPSSSGANDVGGVLSRVTHPSPIPPPFRAPPRGRGSSERNNTPGLPAGTHNNSTTTAYGRPTGPRTAQQLPHTASNQPARPPHAYRTNTADGAARPCSWGEEQKQGHPQSPAGTK